MRLLRLGPQLVAPGIRVAFVVAVFLVYLANGVDPARFALIGAVPLATYLLWVRSIVASTCCGIGLVAISFWAASAQDSATEAESPLAGLAALILPLYGTPLVIAVVVIELISRVRQRTAHRERDVLTSVRSGRSDPRSRRRRAADACRHDGD